MASDLRIMFVVGGSQRRLCSCAFGLFAMGFVVVWRLQRADKRIQQFVICGRGLSFSDLVSKRVEKRGVGLRIWN